LTFSTLTSTLKLLLGLSLCHQTIHSLRFSGGDDGARTRDLCRDRIPEHRNSLKSGVTDGSFQRPETPWGTFIGPLSDPRPLPRRPLPTTLWGAFVGARAPADTSIDQMRLMMQALLADRFHLVTHYRSADAPVFALVLAKPGVTGPNLKPHPPSDVCAVPMRDQSPAPAPRPAAASSSMGDLPPVCGVIAHVPSSSPGQHYGGRAFPLSLFATSVPTMTGLAAIPRPVVDHTGLSGLYDFTLTWMHNPTGEDAAIDDNAANFRDALKTQLGLELKSSHAPISFLIVDHVERPSEN
jgi:uncharacterized protein (TIGR03435 family)